MVVAGRCACARSRAAPTRAPSRNRQKPRMDILMVKSAKFDELVAAEQAAAASSGDAPAAEAAEEAAA